MDILIVKILNGPKDCWYNKGQEWEVYNRLSFEYHGIGPHFVSIDGKGGIDITHVQIMKPKSPIVEYTVDELRAQLGFNFKILI